MRTIIMIAILAISLPVFGQHMPKPPHRERVGGPGGATPVQTFGFPQTQREFIAYLRTCDLTAEQWRVLPQMAAIYRTTIAELVRRGDYVGAITAADTLNAMDAALRDCAS